MGSQEERVVLPNTSPRMPRVDVAAHTAIFCAAHTAIFCAAHLPAHSTRGCKWSSAGPIQLRHRRREHMASQQEGLVLPDPPSWMRQEFINAVGLDVESGGEVLRLRSGLCKLESRLVYPKEGVVLQESRQRLRMRHRRRWLHHLRIHVRAL